MEKLDLNNNTDIGNKGAAILLESLSNVELLSLDDCNISSGMKGKLKERGKEVGCNVQV